jgi:SH3-like domain-containing protein
MNAARMNNSSTTDISTSVAQDSREDSNSIDTQAMKSSFSNFGSMVKSSVGVVSLLLVIGTSIHAQDDPVRGQPTLQPWMGSVTGSVVNIRTGPSTNHLAFFQLRGGIPLIALGGQGDWVEVAVPADRPVWVHGDYLASDGDSLRVTGSRVRLRATAGTKHAPLGLTEPGQRLIPTGKTDANGDWVEVFAPLNAHAWIHGDYIRRSQSEVQALHLSRQHQQLRSIGNNVTGGPVKPVGDQPDAVPVTGGDSGPGKGQTSTEDVVDPNTVKIPAFESPKLKKLFEEFRTETQKNPVEWNFRSLLDQMKVIENSSEDIGEVEVVRDLSRTIQEHFMPLHRRLVDIQRQQEKAKTERELAKAKENEILRRTGHRSTNPGVKYQAVGWVVPLGKHRDVEATHKLMKGNQLLFYLDGGKLKLDLYVNKRVGIVGTVEEQDPSTGARLIRIRSIEVLSQ